ncbi:hypothetical protein QLH51_15325 [Sphingomonas sp. 2R-10]|uniref:hypothetical protein n=1 Tax=Sphingomonas sp. 2R-10 TaxID=3045148 RepID=UPI000F787CC9|nr:hypothetical protein [Sphingomonas sp. 2R-10]MDJ0278169.1 hypothetical protein [Sphingomonas sp. 2R-10]
MDRRHLLALAPLLPFLVSAPAEACSYGLLSTAMSARRRKIVTTLFQHWWNRDRAAFLKDFSDIVRSDGTTTPAKEQKALYPSRTVSASTISLFDRFFADDGKMQRVLWTLDTPAGMIVACNEAAKIDDPTASCSPEPVLHLFMVEMSGLTLQAMTHMATAATPQSEVFHISNGD